VRSFLQRARAWISARGTPFRAWPSVSFCPTHAHVCVCACGSACAPALSHLTHLITTPCAPRTPFLHASHPCPSACATLVYITLVHIQSPPSQPTSQPGHPPGRPLQVGSRALCSRAWRPTAPRPTSRFSRTALCWTRRAAR